MAFPADKHTFTIACEGLMMFQRSPAKTHIAVVDARHHDHKDPRIDIWRVTDGELKEHERIKLKKNSVVSFSVAPGKVTETELYKTYVPLLARFAVGGHIHDDVIDQTPPHKGVLAFCRRDG